MKGNRFSFEEVTHCLEKINEGVYGFFHYKLYNAIISYENPIANALRQKLFESTEINKLFFNDMTIESVDFKDTKQLMFLLTLPQRLFKYIPHDDISVFKIMLDAGYRIIFDDFYSNDILPIVRQCVRTTNKLTDEIILDKFLGDDFGFLNIRPITQADIETDVMQKMVDACENEILIACHRDWLTKKEANDNKEKLKDLFISIFLEKNKESKKITIFGYYDYTNNIGYYVKNGTYYINNIGSTFQVDIDNQVERIRNEALANWTSIVQISGHYSLNHVVCGHFAAWKNKYNIPTNHWISKLLYPYIYDLTFINDVWGTDLLFNSVSDDKNFAWTFYRDAGFSKIRDFLREPTSFALEDSPIRNLWERVNECHLLLVTRMVEREIDVMTDPIVKSFIKQEFKLSNAKIETERELIECIAKILTIASVNHTCYHEGYVENTRTLLHFFMENEDVTGLDIRTFYALSFLNAPYTLPYLSQVFVFDNFPRDIEDEFIAKYKNTVEPYIKNSNFYRDNLRIQGQGG